MRKKLKEREDRDASMVQSWEEGDSFHVYLSIETSLPGRDAPSRCNTRKNKHDLEDTAASPPQPVICPGDTLDPPGTDVVPAQYTSDLQNHLPRSKRTTKVARSSPSELKNDKQQIQKVTPAKRKASQATVPATAPPGQRATTKRVSRPSLRALESIAEPKRTKPTTVPTRIQEQPQTAALLGGKHRKRTCSKNRGSAFKSTTVVSKTIRNKAFLQEFNTLVQNLARERNLWPNGFKGLGCGRCRGSRRGCGGQGCRNRAVKQGLNLEEYLKVVDECALIMSRKYSGVAGISRGGGGGENADDGDGSVVVTDCDAVRNTPTAAAAINNNDINNDINKYNNEEKEKGEEKEKEEEVTNGADNNNFTATMAAVQPSPTDSCDKNIPPWWDPQNPSKVSQVLNVLHVSSAAVPGQLPVCRGPQISRVDTWLKDRLVSGQGGSIYISGLPGTGKSLTAMEIVRRCGRHLQEEYPGQIRCALPPALIAVNCMRFTEARHVVERILAGYRTACRQIESAEEDPLVQMASSLDVDAGGGAAVVSFNRRASSFGTSGSRTATELQDALRQIVLQPLPVVSVEQNKAAMSLSQPAEKKSKTKDRRRSSLSSSKSAGDGRGMIVVILDELDGLLSGRNGDSLVGQLFALAHAPRSRLILVGIANSIDLVQQLMRPGGSLHRHNLKPAHEIFPSYLSSQVYEVISQRVSALPGPVFDPKAILFCARKIANGSGDMRRALEACSRAVSILVADASAAHAKSMVGMRHMAAALSQVTGGIGASNDNVTAIKKLPVPQQLLIATAAKLLGDKLGTQGLSVKVPTAPNNSAANAAARFIGMTTTAVLEQPLLSVPDAPSDLKKGRQKVTNKKHDDVTVADLRGAHNGLCKRVGVATYSSTEFTTAMDMLCMLGLIELKGGVGLGPRQRVVLQIAEDDVLMALADVPILKNVVGA